MRIGQSSPNDFYKVPTCLTLTQHTTIWYKEKTDWTAI